MASPLDAAEMLRALHKANREDPEFLADCDAMEFKKRAPGHRAQPFDYADREELEEAEAYYRQAGETHPRRAHS